VQRSGDHTPEQSTSVRKPSTALGHRGYGRRSGGESPPLGQELPRGERLIAVVLDDLSFRHDDVAFIHITGSCCAGIRPYEPGSTEARDSQMEGGER
jgi:hypothetical protein